MFHVYLLNPRFPGTPLGVGTVPDSDDPEVVRQAGLQQILEYYTERQLKGFGYEILETSGKRRRVTGKFV